MRRLLISLTATMLLFAWPSHHATAEEGADATPISYEYDDADWDTDDYYENDDEDEPEATVIARDEYSFKLRLKVPQVINNSTSRGKRVYKRQTIYGTMYIEYYDNGTSGVAFGELINKNFKLSGLNVRYNSLIVENMLIPGCYNYIGNNATGSFKKPTVCFSVQMEPSYAISVPSNDNSIYITCAAMGSSKIKNGVRVPTYFAGMATGTQGCSCSAYGHISPTRAASLRGPTDTVEDAAATFGRWTAKWQRRVTVK